MLPKELWNWVLSMTEDRDPYKSCSSSFFPLKQVVKKCLECSTGPQWASEEKAAAIWVIAFEATTVAGWRGQLWYSDVSRQSIAYLVVTVIDKDHKKRKVCTKTALSRSPDGPGLREGDKKKDANTKMFLILLLNSRKPSFTGIGLCQPKVCSGKVWKNRRKTQLWKSHKNQVILKINQNIIQTR